MSDRNVTVLSDLDEGEWSLRLRDEFSDRVDEFVVLWPVVRNLSSGQAVPLEPRFNDDLLPVAQ
ncbi:hypothetical protein ACFQMM_22330 [Saliphagus sp. GCM10025308]